MPLAALNRITGEVEVVTKRGKVMQGKIGTKRLAHVRSYLRLRPETSNPALLITEASKAVSYWEGDMIWRRIQKRSGVQKPGQPPDLRVFGQGMARGPGVDRGHPGCARPRVGQDGAAVRVGRAQLRRGEPDDEVQPCRLEQPV